MKCVKLDDVAWSKSASQIVLKSGRPDGAKADELPVYFDGEFVRVGAGGTGEFLGVFVQGIKDRITRHKFLWAVMTAGFTEQVLGLIGDNHVERPTLQQMSDVNRTSLTVNTGVMKIPEVMALYDRLNAMARAGLLRINHTGAIVVATKPGE